MYVLSIREHPEYEKLCSRFFLEHCNVDERVKASIHSCIYAEAALPQWYLLMDNKKIVGGAGLIEGDELSPCLVNLFIKEAYCDDENIALLIKKIKKDAAVFGYEKIYAVTDQKVVYENLGFNYISEYQENMNIYAVECCRIKRLSIRSFRKELMHSIILMLCFEAVFLICRPSLVNWSEFLAFIGFIILFLAIIYKRRCLSIMTILGYLAGNRLGTAFHTITIDSFGRHDNLWLIWTYSYLFCLLMGFVLDIILKKRKQYSLINKDE